MRVNGKSDDTPTNISAQGEFAGGGPGADDAAREAGRPAGAPERSEASTADPAAKAPEPSITGASTSQGAEVKGGGGLDKLEVSCYGNWEIEQFENLSERLDEAKKAAQAERPGASIEHPDGGKVIVKPAGATKGIVYAEWCLEFDGIWVGIARESVSTDKLPNVFVTIHSMILMQLGHLEAWAQAVRLLSGLGYTINRAVPSRFDACVDLVGHSIADYAERYFGGAFICKARKKKLFFEDIPLTGIQFGTAVLCRIYDKVLEGINDPAKWTVLVAYRYGGEAPQSAVRVEYQVRRKAMRKMWSVDTVGDLFEKLPAITSELSSDWLRFTSEKVDREQNHQGRAETWEKWQEVQTMFREAFTQNGVPAPRRHPDVPDISRLMLQAVGCLKSGAAVEEFCPRDVGEFVEWMESKITASLGRDWWQSIRQRAEEFRARSPVNREPKMEANDADVRPDADEGGPATKKAA